MESYRKGLRELALSCGLWCSSCSSLKQTIAADAQAGVRLCIRKSNPTRNTNREAVDKFLELKKRDNKNSYLIKLGRFNDHFAQSQLGNLAMTDSFSRSSSVLRFLQSLPRGTEGGHWKMY